MRQMMDMRNGEMFQNVKGRDYNLCVCEASRNRPYFNPIYYFNYLFHKSMSSLRLFNDPSLEDEDLDPELSQNEESSELRDGKAHPRPGRPRGKGRPKRSTNLIKNKKKEEEEEWQDRGRQKQRLSQNKQQSTVEGYIKIIDYLKKIDYDEGSFQNKMNPYNALTATSFWYTVSAEFFSFDFFNKKNPHDIAMDFLEKINKMPLFLSNRVLKTTIANEFLSFETKQLHDLGQQFCEKLGHLIPSPLPSRPYNSERKANTSTVPQDDIFVSSTRALLYNYISKKIKNSQKWGNILSTFKKNISELAPKQFQRPQRMLFQKEEEQVQQNNLFEILRLQARKKVNKKPKNTSNQKPKQRQLKSENDIFQEEQQNEIKQEQNVIKQQINEVEQKIQLQENIEQQMKDQNHEERLNENIQNDKIQVEINQQQRKSIEEEIFSKEYVKTYSYEDLLLDSILKLPIDKIISILQSNLPTIQIPEIKEDFIPLPTKDPLEFVYQLHSEEEAYLQYMKAHRKKMYKQKLAKNEHYGQVQAKESHFQDAKCQICTDGDYTDDNLIVFCSLCNISLHQRCVGLAKVPAQSWICDVCVAFGPAGINLACPLCNVKGGAMKRTSIHIDTNIFKESNPQYYEYSKKCPYNKEKEKYVARQRNQNDENNDLNNENIVQVVRQRGQKEEECYYDYFVKSTYPTQVPVCHYVWVHYVCAIWIPECYFEQKNGMIYIKGIQNIEKKRFRNECVVCKKNKCGAAVKCQDAQCDKYYHPECARKKKIYMEQLNLQRLKYLIFCEEHEPLKITRQIEYKKKKNREEIIKFARMIEKYIQTYRIAQFPFKLLKSAVQSSFIETVPCERIENRQRKLTISGGSDEQFLKELINNLSKSKMMTVHLQKVQTGYKINNIQTPSKRQIRKCLNRYDQFWNSIKNGESNEDNFRRYERIMLENQRLREKLEIFLNGSLSIRGKQERKEKKVGKKRGKHAAQSIETLIQEQGGIFCICKKPYENETDMFQCEICGQWYHFKCVGFIGTQEDAQSMEFKCMKCMKFEEEPKKDERLKKYAHLFSPNSILYNYRPPTPQLMSQEENQPKNYTQIMHEFNKSRLQNLSPSKKQPIVQVIKPEQPLEDKQIFLQAPKQQNANAIQGQ